MIVPEAGKTSDSPLPQSRSKKRKFVAPETEIFLRVTDLSQQEMERTNWNKKQIDAVKTHLAHEVIHFLKLLLSNVDKEKYEEINDDIDESIEVIEEKLRSEDSLQFCKDIKTLSSHIAGALAQLPESEESLLEELVKKEKIPKNFENLFALVRIEYSLKDLSSKDTNERVATLINALREVQAKDEMVTHFRSITREVVTDFIVKKDFPSAVLILNEIQDEEVKLYLIEDAIINALIHKDYTLAMRLANESPLPEKGLLEIAKVYVTAGDFPAALTFFKGAKLRELFPEEVSAQLSHIAKKLLEMNDLGFAREVIDQMFIPNKKDVALGHLAIQEFKNGNINKTKNIILETTTPEIRTHLLTEFIDLMIRLKTFDSAREFAYEMPSDEDVKKALAKIDQVDPPKSQKLR